MKIGARLITGTGFIALIWASHIGAFAAPVDVQIPSQIGNEVIYQILTDRFEDGNPSNNCGKNDSGLDAQQQLLDQQTCDPQKKDWNRYWGGDFEGIEKRLSYLRNLGVTRIWISPIIENARGFASGDGTLKTAYHGFWGRDWFRLNEHWTNKGRDDLDSLKRLIAAAQASGIGVIVDTVANHSSPAGDAEYGAVYDSGSFVASSVKNESGWFRPYPAIRWELAEAPVQDKEKMAFLRQYLFQHELRAGKKSVDDFGQFQNVSPKELQSFMLQKYMLADLADFDQGKQEVAEYLERAHAWPVKMGVVGYRIDTVRHISLDYWKKFVTQLRNVKPDVVLVGEWFGGGPMNADSMDFVEKTGITIFDFNLRGKFEDLFLKKAGLKDFGSFLQSSIDPLTGKDRAENLVTFVDNHDLPRMQSLGASNGDVLELLKLLFAVRGVPCVYYGLENFLHTKTGGGRDPYNRDWMTFPQESASPGQRVLKALSGYRKAHSELRFGKTKLVTADDRSLIIERESEAGKTRILVQDSKLGRAVPRALKGWRETPLPSSKGSRWTVRYYSPPAEAGR
ncbi:MAG: hypothetical protein A2603_07760 [Bdellovibrionales bacterium RIFOXYD1_FULL_55_31]|nr:MAG: hypothetical protein A2603_07760 [Bdellovibrionales bacterium RIFOXYD1_FULL_55_31]